MSRWIPAFRRFFTMIPAKAGTPTSADSSRAQYSWTQSTKNERLCVGKKSKSDPNNPSRAACWLAARLWLVLGLLLTAF
jgi:hypothetical protein